MAGYYACYGFPQQFVNWTESCVFTDWFSMVGRRTQKLFQRGRNLGLGDPMSLALLDIIWLQALAVLPSSLRESKTNSLFSKRTDVFNNVLAQCIPSKHSLSNFWMTITKKAVVQSMD